MSHNDITIYGADFLRADHDVYTLLMKRDV